jgi:hypothetical protein
MKMQKPYNLVLKISATGLYYLWLRSETVVQLNNKLDVTLSFNNVTWLKQLKRSFNFH